MHFKVRQLHLYRIYLGVLHTYTLHIIMAKPASQLPTSFIVNSSLLFIFYDAFAISWLTSIQVWRTSVAFPLCRVFLANATPSSMVSDMPYT